VRRSITSDKKLVVFVLSGEKCDYSPLRIFTTNLRSLSIYLNNYFFIGFNINDDLALAPISVLTSTL